ncbi:MAG TPA: Fe(3+) ABC transporter substrate-binding protein [Flavobacteriales bacterium]|nr:Fe(3+) ABC transporter substrate-binding protein [Flavobacteriales bacterium]
MKKFTLLSFSALVLFSSCFVEENKSDVKTDNKDTLPQEVNLYSHRHYDIDREIYAEFEKETGIKVNVIEDDADKLMVRLKSEGENSPADIQTDHQFRRLLKAKEEGLLQSVKNETLESAIPANLRDEAGFWFGLTMRARVIVTHKDRVKEGAISSYAELADKKWKKKVLIRSSENVYNQSLIAALIANWGYDKTLAWAKGIVANMARDPKGGDKDQVLAIAAGEGDIAVVNTYYLGKMLSSENPEEVKAAEMVRVIFPDQNGSGTHINISGAGIVKTSPNKANAIRLLEYLTSAKVQEKFAKGNNEYPVVIGVATNELLQGWGDFVKDSLPLSNLGKYNTDALKLFNEAGWK